MIATGFQSGGSVASRDCCAGGPAAWRDCSVLHAVSSQDTEPFMRYKPKSNAALDIALGGLPAQMPVQVDAIDDGYAGRSSGPRAPRLF